MNIEKIKEWCCNNWESITVLLIILIVGITAHNYNQQEQPIDKNQKCKEFELIDKFEENELRYGYIIYYSDGRIEESRDLPQCIKLNK